MVLQVQDILKDAMGLAGATEIDETPSASEMSIALRTCNVMLDRWSAQHLFLRTPAVITFNTVPGQNAYTVGPAGADITVAKPLAVKSATHLASGLVSNIEVIPFDLFKTLADQSVSQGQLDYITFSPGNAQQAAQLGTLYVYPTPDLVYPVTVYVDAYLTELVNFTDSVTFEPMYYEAIIYGLGVRLFRRYNDPKVQIPADLAQLANNAFDTIKNQNSVRTIAKLDIPGNASAYNIYTDC